MLSDAEYMEALEAIGVERCLHKWERDYGAEIPFNYYKISEKCRLCGDKRQKGRHLGGLITEPFGPRYG